MWNTLEIIFIYKFDDETLCVLYALLNYASFRFIDKVTLADLLNHSYIII